MATLALSLAGQVVGGLVGGPIGATIGRALGGLAGASLDAALFSPKSQPSPLGDIRLGGSSEGVAIPKVYGWSRVAGNIVWATDLERLAAGGGGGKALGGGGQEEDEVAVSFALALCEGEVAHLGRIWADGKPLETEGLTIRFHRGTEDQQPDGLIAATQEAAPAYRGIAYLVFERLPLGRFGNRVPGLTVEICRPVGDLEPMVTAMCVIPGATEFGYDPVPRVRMAAFWSGAPENAHLSAARSDWQLSIDELTALCPNLEHVGLVVSWFGTDLRCGHCLVGPRVEAAERQVRGTEWSVAGRGRGEVPVISFHDGAPAYGGTPSDGAVRAAIADLRARGIAVTLYPFVMMDIAQGNELPDPRTGGAGQPAYPWRGRITCDPAPGRPGSPDGTAGAAGQVAAFMANGYRQMILHYAQLAGEAGGVDAFLIGSEMRDLSFVRSGANAFPFVAALRTLAGEARGILGAGTRISYAADWSEYSGFQPPEAPGDRIFHLDPLWADPAVDAVGIDNYMPLADWREGRGHADGQAFASPYGLDYLAANVAGGEGFDWFYAGEADRAAGNRTPIADGAHGEDWVWRYKDLVSWWSNAHHDRVGGVRSATPTAWVPGSKPIWMTELGCGAVDKGANAPNVFGDPKSAENRLPPFSSGAPDALMQRQALRASLAHWHRPGAHNPVSSQYGGRMVDPQRLYLWCWDARPYPAFPTLVDVWADGENHPTGHWLNGRLGGAGAGELLFAMGREFGVPVGRADDAPPLVGGLALDRLSSLREAAEPVLEATGLATRDGIFGIEWVVPDDRAPLVLRREALVRAEGTVVSRRRGDPAEAPGRLTLDYFQRERDYHMVSATALAVSGRAMARAAGGLVLGEGGARVAAEGALTRRTLAADTIEAGLPPSLLRVEPGDVVALEGEADGPFLVAAIRDRGERAITARAHGAVAGVSVAEEPRHRPAPVPSPPVPPLVLAAHLPTQEGGTAIRMGAFAQPWPGTVFVREEATGAVLAELGRPAMLGVLAAPMAEGAGGVWHVGGPVLVELFAGHLASVDLPAALGGANRLAVRLGDGSWEVLGFASAALEGPRLYRLDRVLRGLEGTQGGAAPAGSMAMVLDGRVATLPVPAEDLGGTRAARVFSGRYDGDGMGLELPLDLGPALPLAPVHLSAARVPGSGDVVLRWVRRSRVGGNGWSHGEVPLDFTPEAYRVEIFRDGAVVRTLSVPTDEAVYGAGEQAADFGGLAENFSFGVRQSSPVLGPGHLAMGVFQP